MNNIIVKNINELKNRKGTSDSTVKVLGYYFNNDGGGGNFYWDNISVENDNGGTIFQVNSISTGRWKRIIESNEVSVKFFGAKGDWNGITGTNDIVLLQSAVNYCETNNYILVGTNDEYLINSSLKLGSNSNIDFKGGTLVRGWQPMNNDGITPMNPVLQINKRRHCVLANKDDAVDFNTKHSNISIKNLKFSNLNLYFGVFLALYYVEDLIIDNVVFERTVQDWNTAILANNVTINNLSINQSDNALVWEDGLHILGGKNYNISNCYLKTGDDCIALTPLTNENLENVNINNITVDSNKGFAIKIVNEFTATSAVIKGINISNVSGKVGKTRNGSIAIYNNATAYGVNPKGISEIRISNLYTEGNNNDQTLHLQQAIYLAYVEDVYFDNVTIVGSQKGIFSNFCKDIRFNNVKLYGLKGVTGNSQAPTLITNSSNIKFFDCILLAYQDVTYFASVRLTNTSDILFRDCLVPNLLHSASIIGFYLDGTNNNIKLLDCEINHVNNIGTNYAIRILGGVTDNIQISNIKTNITPYIGVDGNESFSKHLSATLTNLKSDNLTTSLAYTLPIILANSTTTRSVTLGLIDVGDLVQASFIGLDATLVSMTSQVTSANTVLCTFRNFSASPTTAISGTLKVRVNK